MIKYDTGWAVRSGLLLAVVACTEARASDVTTLLAAVASKSRFETPARAEVHIECSEPCPKAGTAAILAGREDAVYLELRTGLRAVIRPDRITMGENGNVAEAAPGQSLADTNLLLEDLAVFTPASLRVPQISDAGPAGVVVTAAPALRSAYALLVHTIDPGRSVIIRTLYYRDSVSNLVKTRRDSAFQEVAGRPRPGEITIETVRGPTTKLVLTWRDAADLPPTLFEAGALEKPSPLTWP
jgi:hypothetical protein